MKMKFNMNHEGYQHPQVTVIKIEGNDLIAVSIGGGSEGYINQASDGGNFEILNNLEGDEIEW